MSFGTRTSTLFGSLNLLRRCPGRPELAGMATARTAMPLPSPIWGPEHVPSPLRHAASCKGDSGSPFKVRNKRRSELWIIRHTGIVRSQAHQRGEAESLIFRYPQIQVLSQHPFVATEVFCVSSGTANTSAHHVAT